MFTTLTLYFSGSESWLKLTTVSSELFLSGYTVYRKDLSDGYGGLFITHCNTLISSEIQLADSSSELVYVKYSLQIIPP